MKQGFSLIELLITLAIVAILSSFAYTNYIKYVTRARRTDALQALTVCANHMTLFYLAHHHYPKAKQTLEMTAGGWYDIKVAASKTQFECIANPKGAQARHDSCGRLSLDETGTKLAEGSGRHCWLG